MSNSPSQQSSNQHVRRISEARDSLGDALTRAEIAGVNPTATVVRDAGEVNIIRAVHAFALEYHSQVQMFQNKEKVQQIWKEPLFEAKIPKSNEEPNGRRADDTADIGGSWYNGSRAITDTPPGYKKEAISLDSLQKWSGRYVSYYVSNGNRYKQFTHKLWIPVAAARAVSKHLDTCLEKLDLLASLAQRRPYDDWREEFEDDVYGGPDSVDLPHKHD